MTLREIFTWLALFVAAWVALIFVAPIQCGEDSGCCPKSSPQFHRGEC